MSQPRRPGSPRLRVLGRVASATLLLTALGWVPGVASAHSALVSAVPADGSAIEGGPGTVRAVFNESLQAGASRLEVLDEHGTRVAEGVAKGGPEITVDVGDLPPGTYTVRWAVVSAEWPWSLARLPVRGTPAPCTMASP